MKIFVKAKPNSREELVEKIDELNYVVSVKEPPIKGMANKAIIKALSLYFKKPAMIISGFSSRNKVFEIK